MRSTNFFAVLFSVIFAAATISAPAEAKNNYDKQANIAAMQMYAQQLAQNGQLPPAPSPWVYNPAPNPYVRAYSNDPYNEPYYYHNGYNPYPVYQPYGQQDYQQQVYSQQPYGQQNYAQQYPQQQATQSSSKWGALLNLLAPQN